MSEEDEHWMGQYSAESQVIAVVVLGAVRTEGVHVQELRTLTDLS